MASRTDRELTALFPSSIRDRYDLLIRARPATDEAVMPRQ